MKKTALTLVSLLLLAGCASDNTNTGLTGFSSGGGNSASLAGIGNSPGSKLIIPNFASPQFATAVLRNTPDSERASASPVQIASSQPALPTQNQGPIVTVTNIDSFNLEMTPDALAAHLADPNVAQLNRKQGGVSPKFQQLAEGAVQNFFISDNFPSVPCQKMHAEADTVHCTIFAEQIGGVPVISKTLALQIAAAFDSDNPFHPGANDGIYDSVRDVFGREWDVAGGRDGDAKVNLVILSNRTISDRAGGGELFGYFRPLDELSAVDYPTSNEGEIVYLTSSLLTGDNFDFLGVLAHEFSHMVSFNNKVIHQGAFDSLAFEARTLEEGRALVCQELLGLGLQSPTGGSWLVRDFVEGFLARPTKGLFQFQGTTDDYGRGYALQRYLIDRFGLAQFKSYVQGSASGLEGLKASYGDFAAIFTDWTLALQTTALAGAVPANLRFTSGFDPKGTFLIRSETGNGSSLVTLPGFQAVRDLNPPQGTLIGQLAPWAFAVFHYSGGNARDLTVEFIGNSSVTGNLIEENPQGTFSSVR